MIESDLRGPRCSGLELCLAVLPIEMILALTTLPRGGSTACITDEESQAQRSLINMSRSTEGVGLKFGGPSGESDGILRTPIVLTVQRCSFPLNIACIP